MWSTIEEHHHEKDLSTKSYRGGRGRRRECSMLAVPLVVKSFRYTPMASIYRRLSSYA
jgi:hypothetical protein